MTDPRRVLDNGDHSGAAEATTLEFGSPDATELERSGSVDVTEMENGHRRSRRFIRRNLPEPLAADYEIVELISDSGAQADVYHARNRTDGTDVALKLYKTTHAIDDHEAALVASADADHVVPTVFGQWGNEKWEIQEYMPFGTLSSLPQILGHPSTNQEITDVATELITAIAHIHLHELVHRDIKPSNILIRTVCPLDLVLADFGLARNLMAGSQVGSITRTQGYAAPEVLQGVQSFDNDWWALGITLLELSMGRHPFSYPDGRRWNEGQIYAHLIGGEVDTSVITDDRLRLLVSGLLTKDREHRWSSIQARAWIAGESPRVFEPPAPAAVASTPRGWVFAGFLGRTYHSTAELGRAFAQNWTEAIEFVGKHGSSLRNALAKSVLADEVTSVFDRRRGGIIREDGALFELISILDPHGEPVFRGRPLTPTGLSAAAASAYQSGPDAAAWITALRRESILQHTSGYADYAAFATIDTTLAGWWAGIDSQVDAVTHRQRDYVGRATAAGVTTIEPVDIPAAVEASRPVLEGALLACALGADQIARVRARVPVIDVADRHAPWIGDLANTAARANPPDPALDLLVAVLDVPAQRDRQIVGGALAAAEQARRDVEIAEERRRRSDAQRARIRQANGGVVAKLLLGLLYLVVVGIGFLLTVGDDPTLSLETFTPLLESVAIGTAVATGVCWLADATLGRPLRWVLAVCVALGFSIGWSGVTGSGDAYALPLAGTAVGYVVAALLTRFLPVLGDADGAEAPLPSAVRSRIGWVSMAALVGVPIAVTQMVMSMSAVNAAKVADAAFELQAEAWPWLNTVFSWFDALARLEPRATAMWAIPCLIAYLVLAWWRMDRPSMGAKYSRADGIVLAIAALGMIVAMVNQWTIALMVTGIIALVLGTIAAAIAIFGS